MKHTSRHETDVGKEVWTAIEKASRVHDAPSVFADWLDLILNSLLSATDNAGRGIRDPSQFDGVYEERYLETVGRYGDGPRGDRPIDHLTEAVAALYIETAKRNVDVLGHVFSERITSGERGQFFAPQPVSALIAELLRPTGPVPETVCDPACGSGGMLIEYGKRNPRAILFGTDVDARCAKMATINMFLFGFNARITWGDALSGEERKHWLIGADGSVIEQDPPPREQAGQQPLLAA